MSALPRKRNQTEIKPFLPNMSRGAKRALVSAVQQLRQFGEVYRQSSRLILSEQLGR
jgi:hypothetical protein